MTEKCRICLVETCKFNCVPITSNLTESKTVLEIIIDCASVEVLESDPLPKYVCESCLQNLQRFYSFWQLIKLSDRKFKEKLKHDSVSQKPAQKFVKEIDVLSDNSSNDSDIFGLNLAFDITELNGKKWNPTTKKKSEKTYPCKECERVFKKHDHLKAHMSYKHVEKQLKCEYCGKKFARIYDLDSHRRVHTGEKPYTCNFCQKSFASSSYLYMHKKIHTGDKKSRCEFCSKKFINSDQLQIHVRQKHTGEKPYLCEKCSSAFASSSALCRHRRDIHEKKETCSICTKMFSSRALKEHIRRHEERTTGTKRYVCEECGKKFTCGTSRKRHMAIHSGEKPFKCEVCQKCFNQKSTLTTHMRTHSPVKRFSCNYCTKCFRYKHHLGTHVETYHDKIDIGFLDSSS